MKITKADFKHFISWLMGQPADETYNYINNRSCLIARYLLAHGHKNVSVVPGHFRSNKISSAPYPLVLDKIARCGTGDKARFAFGETLKYARKEYNKMYG